MEKHEKEQQAKIEIRALGNEELEQALHFIWEVYARTEAHMRSDDAIQDFLCKIDFEYAALRMGEGVLRFWGAYMNEKLIGVCAFRGLGQVYLLYVDPRAQGNGVATRLLKRAVFDSKRHDDELARIVVEAPDIAVGFFAKLGFEALSKPEEDCGVDYTAMELKPEAAAAAPFRENPLGLE